MNPDTHEEFFFSFTIPSTKRSRFRCLIFFAWFLRKPSSSLPQAQKPWALSKGDMWHIARFWTGHFLENTAGRVENYFTSSDPHHDISKQPR